MMNCDKFLTDNDECCYNNCDYKRIKKYLLRFVILYIKNGLTYPLTENKRIFRMARFCLMLTYCAIDDKDKLRLLLCNDNNVNINTDSEIGDIRHVCTVDTIKKFAFGKSNNYTKNNSRMVFFIKSIKELRCSSIKADGKVDTMTLI